MTALLLLLLLVQHVVLLHLVLDALPDFPELEGTLQLSEWLGAGALSPVFGCPRDGRLYSLHAL